MMNQTHTEQDQVAMLREYGATVEQAKEIIGEWDESKPGLLLAALNFLKAHLEARPR
jgi:hypothetical protein